MNEVVFFDSLKFYFVAVLVVAFFSIPFIFFLYKKRKPIDLFLVYILGVLNLFFCLFIYANFNNFWDIRKFDLLLFLSIVVFLQIAVLYWKLKGFSGFLAVKNVKHFVVILLVGVGLFYYFNLNYWDPVQKKLFNPGYGINDDYITLMTVVKSFLTMNSNSNETVRNYYYLFKGSGYPVGGTYVHMFFSKIFKTDPYFIYQKVLVWTCLLNLYVINYFVLKKIKKLNFLCRVVLVIFSAFSIFNFLSLGMINSSVFASSAVIPFVLFGVLWTLVYFGSKKMDELFYVVLLITLSVVFFLYSCFGGIFYLFFLVALPMVYGRMAFRKGFWFSLLLVFALAIALPLNVVKNVGLLKMLFTSTNVELNLFKGMAGNTIGFVNPMLATGVWFSSPDYRFFTADYYNTWLVFGLLGGLFWLLFFEKIKTRDRRWILVLTITFTLLIAITFWGTKSFYQNVKALQFFSNVWPLILFLMLWRNLKSKRLMVRLITIAFIGVYMFYAVKSSVFAFSYFGKPIVKSNYELMEIASEFCQGDENKLFLGRDEVSVYFLVNCKNVKFYYDRFANNLAFWEIINLNKLDPVAECKDNSYKLTKIDFTLYKKVLVDKCFKFDNPKYRVEKEYKFYRLWTEVN